MQALWVDKSVRVHQIVDLYYCCIHRNAYITVSVAYNQTFTAK